MISAILKYFCPLIIMYGIRPESMHLAPLDSWACMLKEAFNIFVICIIIAVILSFPIKIVNYLFK